MAKAKATKAIFDMRALECADMLIERRSTKEILRFGSEKWSVTPRQVETYVSRAHQLLSEKLEKEKKYKAWEMIRTLDDIIEQAMDDSSMDHRELNTARAAVMDKAKLFGMLKDQVEISGSVQTGLEEINDGDFEAAFPTTDELDS